MKQTNLKQKGKLALVLLLALLFLLTGCPTSQPPTTDSTWDNARWDSTNWQ